jgi:hypothetical protein
MGKGSAGMNFRSILRPLLFFHSFFRAPAYTSVANWTLTFSPRSVNEARLGANYMPVNNGGLLCGRRNLAFIPPLFSGCFEPLEKT